MWGRRAELIGFPEGQRRRALRDLKGQGDTPSPPPPQDPGRERRDGEGRMLNFLDSKESRRRKGGLRLCASPSGQDVRFGEIDLYPQSHRLGWNGSDWGLDFFFLSDNNKETEKQAH